MKVTQLNVRCAIISCTDDRLSDSLTQLPKLEIGNFSCLTFISPSVFYSLWFLVFTKDVDKVADEETDKVVEEVGKVKKWQFSSFLDWQENGSRGFGSLVGGIHGLSKISWPHFHL